MLKSPTVMVWPIIDLDADLDLEFDNNLSSVANCCWHFPTRKGRGIIITVLEMKYHLPTAQWQTECVIKTKYRGVQYWEQQCCCHWWSPSLLWYGSDLERVEKTHTSTLVGVCLIWIKPPPPNNNLRADYFLYCASLQPISGAHNARIRG